MPESQDTAEFDQRRAHRGLMGGAWRYLYAQSLPSSLPPRLAKQCDPLVRDLRRYLTLKAEGPQGAAQAMARFPSIAVAFELDEDAGKVDKLKMMVLAGMALDEIHTRVGIEPAVATVWEQIFFDVRDLRHATSWLASNVIAKERDKGKAELAAHLKLAICAGPSAVRAICDVASGAPVDEAERLFERHLRLCAKVDEAVAMPVTSEKHAVQLLKNVAQLELEKKRLELEGQKLAQRCAAAHDRHELAKQRLELAARRAESRLAERQRRVDKQYPTGSNCTRASDVRMLDRQLAEQQARAVRAAACPLAQLTWGAEPEEADGALIVPLTETVSTHAAREPQLADEGRRFNRSQIEARSADDRPASLSQELRDGRAA